MSGWNTAPLTKSKNKLQQLREPHGREQKQLHPDPAYNTRTMSRLNQNEDNSHAVKRIEPADSTNRPCETNALLLREIPLGSRYYPHAISASDEIRFRPNAHQ
jgi:hypothetical protein